MNEPTPAGPPSRDPGRYAELARRTLTVAAVAAAVAVGLFILFYAVEVFLLVFAALLVAVLLRGLADRLSALTRLGPGWSLAVVTTALVAIFALAGWLIVPGLARQADQLGRAFTDAGNSLRDTLSRYEWGQRILQESSKSGSILYSLQNVWGGLAGLFSASMNILIGVIVVLFVGLFLAANPDLYMNGFLRLLAPSRRERGREILRAVGQRMAWWLTGRGISMAVVGTATGLGLWLLGVPLALTLGLLTGLLNFVPTFGPLIAIVPTALVALTASPTEALYAVALYSAVACADGYILTPLVQQRMARVPPALLLVAQILMGVLAGHLGLALAAPLLAAVMVVVQKAYVEDVLEKPDKPPIVPAG